MGESVSQIAAESPNSRPASIRVLVFLRVYRWPLVALLLGAPLTGYALACSLSWFAAPFPGFLIMNNAVVPSVSGINWPKERAALFHSRIVAIDDTRVTSSAAVYEKVAGYPPGTPFTYRLEKAGRESQLTLPSQRFTLADYLQVYGILLVISSLSLIIGVVVGFMQPTATQSRLYLRLSFVVCVWAGTAVFLHLPGHPLLTITYFVAESCFPAALIHLALHFPAERRFTGRSRLIPAVPYLLSAILATAVLIGFFRHPPTVRPLHLTYLYTAASFLFSLLAMLFAYWENREPRVRLRVKAILPSFVLGGALVAFAFINNAAAGGDFPMQLGLLLIPLVYVSVAYAIAKHDLFDIDRFVRQSFIYGLLSLIVIGAYALVLVIPARFMPSLTGGNQALLGMAFVLVLAFALDPLRALVQNVVDRAFYRTRLDYRGTISGLSTVMTTLLDFREVVSQVTHVLTEAMHLESTTVCLFDDDGPGSTLWSRAPDGHVVHRECNSDRNTLLRALRHLPHAFNTTTLDHVRSRSLAAMRALLDATAARVVLQLVVAGRPIGILLLGPKRSGQLFTSDDVELLQTLANQTAIAIQNARSYDALEELTSDLDAKIREQERMYQMLQDRELRLAATAEEKDRLYKESLRYQRNLQLLSRRMMQVSERTMQRIAHELHDDLGQALTSVKMQLSLIERTLPEEGAARDLVVETRAQVATLLQSVRHLSQLLRPAVLDDLGLVPAMQSYVGRFGTRTGITVRLQCPSVDTRLPPPIEVALYRVLQEALTNIARHAEARHVDIELTVGADAVGLRIADDGRGFDAARFLENPPAGHGMGVLGMRERVATYGGQFDVQSAPGHGAIVTLAISLTQPILEPQDDYSEDSRLAG